MPRFSWYKYADIVKGAPSPSSRLSDVVFIVRMLSSSSTLLVLIITAANFGVVLSQREIELRLLRLAIGGGDVDAPTKVLATFPVDGPLGHRPYLQVQVIDLPGGAESDARKLESLILQQQPHGGGDVDAPTRARTTFHVDGPHGHGPYLPFWSNISGGDRRSLLRDVDPATTAVVNDCGSLYNTEIVPPLPRPVIDEPEMSPSQGARVIRAPSLACV
ncbi:hypothetical protein HYPSUDRAFT_206482 [Hypholoma sublateritium FD-334 SS-4]|uniref:Uncharacterized protein n=1 Tax=Hypholoma sublateritium (strain FD-334 SS-4) TaxID=945553 RepID=A0A0D2P9U1_HYPSF|nr:hypothetical protein HYPSUDRAFT_206482 [Hypholoma sublateritium FD-334 SS-4]